MTGLVISPLPGERGERVRVRGPAPSGISFGHRFTHDCVPHPRSLTPPCWRPSPSRRCRSRRARGIPARQPQQRTSFRCRRRSPRRSSAPRPTPARRRADGPPQSLSRSSAGSCEVIVQLANGGTYAVSVTLTTFHVGGCGDGLRITGSPNFVADGGAGAGRFDGGRGPRIDVDVERSAAIDTQHLKLLSLFHYIGAGFALLGLIFLGLHYLMFSTVMKKPRVRERSWFGGASARSSGRLLRCFSPVLEGLLFCCLGLKFLRGFSLGPRRPAPLLRRRRPDQPPEAILHHARHLLAACAPPRLLPRGVLAAGLRHRQHRIARRPTGGQPPKCTAPT